MTERSQVKNKFFLLIIPFFVFLACLDPTSGISPIEAVAAFPEKIQFRTSGDKPHPVRVILHVDAENYNPLNAKDYFIRDWVNPGTDDQPNLIQFFDTVILGHSYLEKLPHGNGRLRLTPALQYILDNNAKYIRPLRSRGIKVLIEVRSGNLSCSPACNGTNACSKPGTGFGFGTMDIRAATATIQDFRLLADRYSIDGFELNDIGAGFLAYPPFTRYVTRFESSEPLYSDKIFQNKDGKTYCEEIIREILWLEGGNNLSNFTLFLYEELTNVFSMMTNHIIRSGRWGNIYESISRKITPLIIVRQNGHGSHLFNEFRLDLWLGSNRLMAYAYIVQDFSGLPAYIPNNHAIMFNPWDWGIHPFIHFHLCPLSPDYVNNSNDPAKCLGAICLRFEVKDADEQFVPFILDLSNLLPTWATTAFRNFFLGNNDPNLTNPVTTPRRLGALYFKNLPPVSDTPSQTTLTRYLTRFSVPIFGTAVTLTEGGGDHQVNWGR